MATLKERIWDNIYTRNLDWYLQFLINSMEDFSTLILGETGVGKTAIARVIGCSGFIPYDEKPGKFRFNFMEIFRSINVSEYPTALVESALFGHCKGSFTCAIEDRKGLFELSNGCGAIFIDELGETNKDIQVKFLTVLQDRLFSQVGSHKPKKFSGRVIAATNRNIHDLVKEGKFREDLYYRLCSDIIEIPPLRTRIAESKEELSLILDNIVKRVVTDIDSSIIEKIEQLIIKSVGIDYPWPGNIRELEQAVRRICLTGSYKPIAIRGPKQDVFNQNSSAKQLLEQYASTLYQEYESLEAVSKIMDVDPRTVKKYLNQSK